MKNLITLLFSFFLLTLFSQDKNSFSKEIGIVSENDAYMLGNDDGYYTNGLEIYLNWKGKDSLKIHTLAVGQLMYNAQNGDYSRLKDIDRPVTAYLHLTYRQTRFTAKGDLLNWGVSAGAIGPLALGKEAQVLLHETLNMYNPEDEWKFQLKNSVGVNGEITWAREFPIRSYWEIQGIAKARAGFFFNNIEAGPLIRLGRFNNNTHTTFWNTRLNTGEKQSRKELFFYFYSSLSVYAYNATVQGGLFRSDKGPVTGKLNPFLYHHTIGIMGSRNRLALNLAVNYQTKETPSQERTQWYGTIELKYLFR